MALEAEERGQIQMIRQGAGLGRGQAKPETS